jgi:hypothetical protein
MGWSSTLDLCSEIIKSAKKYIPDSMVREMFYKGVIIAFEVHDQEDLEECIEDDFAFDRALKQLHPEWDEEH